MEFHRAGMVQMAGAPAQPIPIGIGKVRDEPDAPCLRDPEVAQSRSPAASQPLAVAEACDQRAAPCGSTRDLAMKSHESPPDRL